MATGGKGEPTQLASSRRMRCLMVFMLYEVKADAGENIAEMKMVASSKPSAAIAARFGLT